MVEAQSCSITPVPDLEATTHQRPHTMRLLYSSPWDEAKSILTINCSSWPIGSIAHMWGLFSKAWQTLQAPFPIQFLFPGKALLESQKEETGSYVGQMNFSEE